MVENREVMARNIQKYMERDNVKATDICKALNFKQNTFSDWIHAKTYPRIDAIEKLANYFHISKADLVEEADSVVSKSSHIQIVDSDAEILNQYYLLDEWGKHAVLETLHRELKRCSEQNSIHSNGDTVSIILDTTVKEKSKNDFISQRVKKMQFLTDKDFVCFFDDGTIEFSTPAAKEMYEQHKKLSGEKRSHRSKTKSTNPAEHQPLFAKETQKEMHKIIREHLKQQSELRKKD